MPASNPELLPALALIMVPGRRPRSLELAQEIERRGFPSIWSPGRGNAVATAGAILAATSTVKVGTAIQPIYTRHASDLASNAAFLHEMYDGRFRLGIGVAHIPLMSEVGVDIAKARPLADMRAFVHALRAEEKEQGPMPPIVLATLRDKMVDLAVEVGDGAVWANGSRSFMAKSVARIPKERREAGFAVANMMPTVIDEDPAAARAINRRTMNFYLNLPNYRNYWRAAGFAEDMDGAEKAIAEGRPNEASAAVSDHWLDDVTISGTPSQVREKVESYIAEGLGTPILVPSAVKGGQFKAFEDVFATFS